MPSSPPTPQTLAAQLQSILDQGASSGEFTAQQAVFTPVMELVKEVTRASGPPTATRSTPRLPTPATAARARPLPVELHHAGLQGPAQGLPERQRRVALKWNAGTKLFDRVIDALATCNEGGGGLVGECRFSSLLTRIDRRIYTTSRNGVFGATIGNLTDLVWLNGNGNRTILWPAPARSRPTTDAGVGQPRRGPGLCPSTRRRPHLRAAPDHLSGLRGAPLPASCTAAQPLKTQRARREAREMILAYMAGAKVVRIAGGLPPKRMTRPPASCST